MKTEITSLRIKAGARGDGTPAFSDEKIPAAMRTGGRGIPCEMRELSDFTIASLAAREISAERSITLPRRALTAIGVGDLLGARLVIQRLEPGTDPADGSHAAGEQPAAETRDVVRQREAREGTQNMVTLTLSPRLDAADGGSA